MRSRLAAWLVTGPVGHGYAGCADVASLLSSAVRRRVTSRSATARGWLAARLDRGEPDQRRA